VPREDLRFAACSALGILVLSAAAAYLFVYNGSKPELRHMFLFDSDVVAVLLVFALLTSLGGLLVDLVIWVNPERSIIWHKACAAQPIIVASAGSIPALLISVIVIVAALAIAVLMVVVPVVLVLAIMIWGP